MRGGIEADVRTYQLYINGEWVDSKSGRAFPVYDPSTEQVIAQVPDANAHDVNRAVAAAKAAFEDGPWATTTPQERGRVLFRLAEKIRQNSTMLAELESRNSGKPIVEAEFDIADVATCFEYYGGLATKILGFVNPVPDNAVSLTLKEPIGIAGQIIPWNYPLLMAAWKLAPALAFSNPPSRRRLLHWKWRPGSLMLDCRQAWSILLPVLARVAARPWCNIRTSTRLPSPAARQSVRSSLNKPQTR
jgi:delta 1-pyrroline-5-carboxylate dehydrogenase